MKNIIIASTSTLHGGEYLDYLLPELQSFFSNVKELLFIPYARPSGISHDDYTKKVSEAFAKININVKGIHEFENPIEALEKAQGIFTGGGNTFLLVSQLYKNDVIDTLEKVVKNGIPYLGTSAGRLSDGVQSQLEVAFYNFPSYQLSPVVHSCPSW